MNLDHGVPGPACELQPFGETAAGSHLPTPVSFTHAVATSCKRCEQGNTGIVILGTDGRVLYASTAARTMARRADALALQGATLRALRQTDDDALQALIADALRNEDAVAAMPLARRYGDRDYFVVVKALPRHASAGREPAVLVTIADPDCVPQPSAAWLKRLFGLTSAEAQVALNLFAGSTLSELARALGVSQATARVHLAHIFRKTRTTRQAQLIRLLMSYPWGELGVAAPKDARQRPG
ncbi:MAG TPA: PAS domain-containing protein [Rhizomicrobium sp.]